MASLGTWPATIKPRSARLTLQTNQRANAAPGGGSEQVVDMLNDRWMMNLTLPRRLFDDAAAVEAFLASFRGQVNTVNAWHFARPVPRGTITGACTVSGAHVQSADSLVIQTAAGLTVKAGDLVGVGGLLLMASADATADGAGVLTMPLVNRLRTALADAAAITLTQPTVAFRCLSHTGVEFAQGMTDEVSMVLGEAI